MMIPEIFGSGDVKDGIYTDRLLDTNAAKSWFDDAIKKYDPRQPRDDHGKWSNGAGGISVGHALHVMKSEGIADTAHHDAVRSAIESGQHKTREDVLAHIDSIHAPAAAKLRKMLPEHIAGAQKYGGRLMELADKVSHAEKPDDLPLGFTGDARVRFKPNMTASAEGSEAIHGVINIGPSFFEHDQSLRKNILFHEVGHLLATAAQLDSTDDALFDKHRNKLTPKGVYGTDSQPSEFIAQRYADYHSDPSGFEKEKPDLAKDLRAAMVKYKMPLPDFPSRNRKSLDEFSETQSMKTSEAITDDEMPASLPDPFGLAFTDAELESLTDVNSEEAVKLAFAQATPAKRALLGAQENE